MKNPIANSRVSADVFPVRALIRQFAEVERKIDGNPERLMTLRAKIETWSFDLPCRRGALCQFLYFYISWLHNYESLVINYFRDTLDTFASIYIYIYIYIYSIYAIEILYIYTQYMYTRIYCRIYLRYKTWHVPATLYYISG